MSPFHFAVTALATLIFAVWVNLNFTVDNVFYWPALFVSPFVFMLAIVIVTKTFFGFMKLFCKN